MHCEMIIGRRGGVTSGFPRHTERLTGEFALPRSVGCGDQNQAEAYVIAGPRMRRFNPGRIDSGHAIFAGASA